MADKLNRGMADGLDGGLVLDRDWMLSRHRMIPPLQLSPVEDHGMMVIGPDPDQRVYGGIVERCTYSEPAELLHIPRTGDLCGLGRRKDRRYPCHGEEENRQTKTFKQRGKTKRGKGSAAYSF